MAKSSPDMETATIAGGCFWCTEAIFRRLKGVYSVVSGYSGGQTSEPSYEEVSAGQTNHAEVIQIQFDPKIISYYKLLEVFFKLHDPTTMNKQGGDIGTQYRSAIFYLTPEQKKAAEKTKDQAQKLYPNKIITEITPFKAFYRAEGYHQDYYEKNRSAGYCQIVIDPKIHKLYKDFKEVVKEEYKA